MESSAAAVITKAMEGLSARLATTAENIANANTANYRPMRVSFEEALAAAAQKDDAAVRAVKPQFSQTLLGQGGPELRLDLELLSETATAGRYSALVELLNRQFQIQGLAILGNG